MLDVIVSFRRYHFLGLEFLTWLFWASENHPDMVEEAAGMHVALRGRLVVERTTADGVERVVITGSNADLAEGMVALGKGGYVSRARLFLEQGGLEWALDVAGESLFVSGLQLPGMARQDREAWEPVAMDRMAAVEKPVNALSRLFTRFLELRSGGRWAQAAGEIRQWIRENGGATDAA